MITKKCVFWLLDGKGDPLPDILADIDIAHTPRHDGLYLVTIVDQLPDVVP